MECILDSNPIVVNDMVSFSLSIENDVTLLFKNQTITLVIFLDPTYMFPLISLNCLLLM